MMKPKAKTMIERLGFNDPDRKNPTHDEIQLEVMRNIWTYIPDRSYPNGNVISPETWDIYIKLEKPVIDRNFTIGFIDIYLTLRSKEKVEIKDRYGPSFRDHDGWEIGIEVKTKIDSIGDLLRQINFYRTYGTCSWIVVSPDDRFADVLRSQSIHFFKYRNPNELPL